MMMNALVVVSLGLVCASVASAGCPPGKKVTVGPAVNISMQEEQCGHYATPQNGKPAETCCPTKEDVYPDKLMLIPGWKNSSWDNNNKGCKLVSTECNDWMMFYMCGINCSPVFTTYADGVDKTKYPGGYRVCDKILGDLRENCKDDEWPKYWPYDPNNQFNPSNVQCKNFPDLFDSNDKLATDLFAAEPKSGACYNAGEWLRPQSFLTAALLSLAAYMTQ
jgi:hypothetical protein